MTSQVLTLLRTLDERQVNLSLKGEGLDITAPQGAIDSALLRELKAHKADIVMLLKKREEERARRASIVAVDSAQPQPLSFAQQRLWFLSLLGQSLDGAAADSAIDDTAQCACQLLVDAAGSMVPTLSRDEYEREFDRFERFRLGMGWPHLQFAIVAQR